MARWPRSSYRSWFAMHRAFEDTEYPFLVARQEGVNGSFIETHVTIETSELFKGFERFELTGYNLAGMPKGKLLHLHWSYSEYDSFLKRQTYLPALGERAR